MRKYYLCSLLTFIVGNWAAARKNPQLNQENYCEITLKGIITYKKLMKENRKII